MTPIDTALVDACVESITKDTPITRSFANAISIMKIPMQETTDRQAQMRQLEDKLDSVTRPEKRVMLFRIIKKLFDAEAVSTGKPKK